MKRISIIFAGVLGLVIFLWRFPLIHIVALDRSVDFQPKGAFDAMAYASNYWSDGLFKSLNRAVDANVLIPLIQSDSAAARKQFSRKVGLSDSYTYFLAGEGKIVAVSDKEISLTVTPGATKPEVSLQAGFLFGNALRDAPGLIDVSEFSNSQDFNMISQELNRIVEATVLPDLRAKAKVGVIVRFYGCAEVNDPTTDLQPLRVVPIEAVLP